MTKGVFTIDLNKTIFEAAILLSKKKIGCLVVTDNEVPLGIVTERDFVRRVVAKRFSLNIKISEIMSKLLITVDPDSSLREASRLILKNKIRRFPVVKRDKLVGIIVVSDFARHLDKEVVIDEYLDAIARKIKTEEKLEFMEHYKSSN